MSEQSVDRSINGWNGEYVDAMYQQWQADPGSVAPEFRQFFEGFDLGYRAMGTDDAGPVEVAHTKQSKVDSLIYHYRDIGHLAADLDPLGTERPYPKYLQLDSFDLTDADLGEPFDPGILPLPNPSPLRDIIQMLKDTYCRHIGVEYMHIQDRSQRRWLQRKMEPVRNRPEVPHAQKNRIFNELKEAHGLEQFVGLRYRGKKWFSLEGGESLNPMLNEIIDHGPSHDAHEFTIGMAHRGRINVLVNILNKGYDQLFTEFEESWEEDYLEGGGDVKYHKGYSSDVVTTTGETVRLTLSPNPSHLEFGHSVVLGRARAKQRLRGDQERASCIPILIHGDAAFPAQGIVAEMFNMSRLDGYTVGGAIHVVVNNQVGFTTDPRDAHSGKYCTDIAKMVEAPIFHVNGDDPEACAWTAMMALEYRQTFKRDVVIDMWCFRRYGHNEGDEPSFTQPMMYKHIKQHKPVYELYVDQLAEEGVITRDEAERVLEEHKKLLDESQERSKTQPVSPDVEGFRSVWGGLTEEYIDEPVETGIDRKTLGNVAKALGAYPESFTPHRKLAKLLEQRGGAVADDTMLPWAMGELLAYGTLLLEQHDVRLTGQDVQRGTFSHRHAVLFDQNDGREYHSLNHINADQGHLCIHNSPLTESACLGFEYGYSLGDPNQLIIWEAQFGDFVNGAQVIIDQFIASAEVKWKRCSGITLFLPHGYEGQGPEHSSARLGRFLQLCAQNNMQVVYPTTPSQMFHVLRRQLKRAFRKPLVIMTPKSLLRHPQAVSPVSDLVDSRFHHVLDDVDVADPKAVKRLLLCSGKVYYDLAAKRAESDCPNVAIVRLEQLYPLRVPSIRAALDRYPNITEHIWVQEEPRNMGAWSHVRASFNDDPELNIALEYVGREASASPAVASLKMHQHEQDRITSKALGLTGSSTKAIAPKKRLASAG